MRKIFIGFLILVSNLTFCQEPEIIVPTCDVVFGMNILKAKKIRGVEYIFPDLIHDTYVDTTADFLTVQLRGVNTKGRRISDFGDILQYDLQNSKVLWTKPMEYQIGNLQQVDGLMIYTQKEKSFAIDTKTGEDLSDLKSNIYFADPEINLGIGYRYKRKTGFAHHLEGLDLDSGIVRWKKILNREYGWNDMFFTSDSTLLVVSSGLHEINVNTGRGWRYHTVTGKKDFKKSETLNAIGLASGMLTGTFYSPPGYDVIGNIVSNVLSDSSSFYFSSRDQLAKIDQQSGEVMWNYPFDWDLASKSSLFLYDSLLIMINHGYASMGYNQIKFGKPFVAAFNRLTGEEEYLSIIEAKDKIVLDYLFWQNQIYLIFRNRIAIYSPQTGALLSEKFIQEKSFGELRSRVGTQIFIPDQEGGFVNLHQSDSTNVFVYTSMGQVLAIDNQLNISDAIRYTDLYSCYLSTEDFHFIAKDKQTWIINNEGVRVAGLKVSSNAYLIGTTLYDRQDDRFIVIDLKGVLEEE